MIDEKKIEKIAELIDHESHCPEMDLGIDTVTCIFNCQKCWAKALKEYLSEPKNDGRKKRKSNG